MKAFTILILLSTLILVSYQPIVSNKSFPNDIGQLEEKRDLLEENQDFDTVFDITLEIYNFYSKNENWEKAIKNLEFAIVYSEYSDITKKRNLILEAITLVELYPLKDDTLKALIYQHYGEMLIEENKYDSALYYMTVADQAFTTSDWTIEKANTQNVLARIYYEKGKYEKAIQYLLEAEKNAKTLEGDDANYILDLCYSLLGAVYYAQDDLENAILYTSKAAALIENIESPTFNDSLYLAEIYQNLAVYLKNTSSIKYAKLYFEQSLQYYNLLEIPKNEFVDVIINYSTMLCKSGELQKSIETLKAATEENEQNEKKETYFLHKLKINKLLGENYRKKELLDSAFLFINQASLYAQKLEVSEEITNLMISKSELLFESKKLRESQKLIQQALLNLSKTTNQRTKVDKHSAYILLGKIEHHFHNYKKALKYFQQSLINATPDITKNSGNIKSIKVAYNSHNLIKSLENIAITHQSINSLESLKEAFNYYQAVIIWIEKMRQGFAFESSKVFLNESSSRIYKNALVTAQSLYKLTQDEKYLNEAFILIEKQKSNLLLEALIDRERLNTLGVPKILLEREAFLKNKLAYYQQKIIENNQDKVSKLMYQDYFDRYQLAFANFKDTLSSTYQEYFDLEYKNELADINIVQNELIDNQSAFIQFKIIDSICLAFIIEKDKKQMLTFPYSAKVQYQINKLLTQMSSNAFLAQGNKAYSDFNIVSNQVYTVLLSNIITQLSPNIQSLTIAADRQLNFLPFEALLKSPVKIKKNFRDMPYLIKDFAFHYGYSATLLYQNKKSYQALHTNQQMLAFAPSYKKEMDASLPSRGKLEILRGNFSTLKGAAKEVKAISELFNGYFDCSSNATETEFKSRVSNYGLLHLAMHGISDQNNPHLAHLVFANQSNDSLNDNKLYHYEIAELSTSAQLAVLSACETGIGKNVEGEGVMSLGRSFMYSGVPSVVMSLWKIEDNATSELLPLFYKYLAEGKSKNIALQQAKLEYLENSFEIKTHPFYWAGIISLGNHEPLKDSDLTSKMFYLLIGLLLLIFLIIAIRYNRRIQGV